VTQLDPPSPIETPVWLELNGRTACTWLCTPSLLDALACGWLNGQGLIADRRELLELEVDADARWVKARTSRKRLVVQETLVAGPDNALFSLERIPEEAPRSVPDLALLIAAGELRNSFQEMYRRCPLRAAGGGVHSGALLVDGTVLCVAEDVGRHNVTDKLIGAAILEGVPLRGSLILISARISAQMAVKAWRGGVGGIATLSVPTSLARDIARRAGVWLVGRSLRGSPHVYAPAGEAPV
jgi:FdhD protein